MQICTRAFLEFLLCLTFLPCIRSSHLIYKKIASARSRCYLSYSSCHRVIVSAVDQHKFSLLSLSYIPDSVYHSHAYVGRQPFGANAVAGADPDAPPAGAVSSSFKNRLAVDSYAVKPWIPSAHPCVVKAVLVLLLGNRNRHINTVVKECVSKQKAISNRVTNGGQTDRIIPDHRAVYWDRHPVCHGIGRYRLRRLGSIRASRATADKSSCSQTESKANSHRRDI